MAIFTRDMSWAGEARIKRLLMTKAQANELTICMPKMIPLAQELADAGAKILTYPQLDFVPSSRFTIINADRMDAQVAIGRTIGEYHVIEEHAAGTHPIHAVTKDLVELVRQVSET